MPQAASLRWLNDDSMGPSCSRFIFYMGLGAGTYFLTVHKIGHEAGAHHILVDPFLNVPSSRVFFGARSRTVGLHFGKTVRFYSGRRRD